MHHGEPTGDQKRRNPGSESKESKRLADPYEDEHRCARQIFWREKVEDTTARRLDPGLRRNRWQWTRFETGHCFHSVDNFVSAGYLPAILVPDRGFIIA